MNKQDTPGFSSREPMRGRGKSKTLAEETAPRKPREYVFAVFLAVGLVVFLNWTVFGSSSTEDDFAQDTRFEAVKPKHFSPSDFLVAWSNNVNAKFPDQSSENISEQLTEQASNAVVNDDAASLANAMMSLGVNALREEDIDASALYLDEALAIVEEQGDEINIARVELLRGELNIMKRANARRAAYAYDTVQRARWKVAHGQFHDAIADLEYSITENLELKRFGAAAAIYQTLYKGYTKHGQFAEAQHAGIQIVKLHASSGRQLKANTMLENLKNDGLDNITAEQLQRDSIALQLEYEHSVGQIGQARDYQRLYNHLIHAGDPVRAWQFRVKAQRSLSGVSQRAMHRSQTGVVALLYTSNDHMANAAESLERAQRLFSQNDLPELSAASSRLSELSY